MNKKRSIGVTMFGLVLLLTSSSFFIHFIIMTLRRGFTYYIFKSLGSCIAILLSIILSIGILKLKNWARIICLVFAWIGLIVGAYAIIVSLISEQYGSSPAIVIAAIVFIFIFFAGLSIVFFLNNPNVKKQFTQNIENTEGI